MSLCQETENLLLEDLAYGFGFTLLILSRRIDIAKRDPRQGPHQHIQLVELTNHSSTLCRTIRKDLPCVPRHSERSVQAVILSDRLAYHEDYNDGCSGRDNGIEELLLSSY